MEKINFIGNLLSIIVPVYNVKDYLDKCIESISLQTYENIEILLIDDGSTDGSSKICDLWKAKDSRIRVFHKNNGGSSSARNVGLKNCRGEFIGFVDSDDYIDKNMYELMLKEMRNDIDIVTCGTGIIYPAKMKKRTEVYGMTSKLAYFKENEAIMELLLLRGLSFSPCDKVFRSVLFENVRFPYGKECEDLPTIYELIKKSRGIINIGKVKYFYFYRIGSMSRKPFQISRMSYIVFARDIVKDVILNYPDYKKIANAMFINNILVIIHEIKMSENREKYLKLEKRLKLLLLKMQPYIWINDIIPRKTKGYIIRILL
jgi:glycosyltransferase involved in cell wall biosynthesis